MQYYWSEEIICCDTKFMDFPTHKKHEIKCPTKTIDFTVQYFDNYYSQKSLCKVYPT